MRNRPGWRSVQGGELSKVEKCPGWTSVGFSSLHLASGGTKVRLVMMELKRWWSSAAE